MAQRDMTTVVGVTISAQPRDQDARFSVAFGEVSDVECKSREYYASVLMHARVAVNGFRVP